MRNLFILGLAALLALPAAAAEPVAIVYSLAGEATVTAPDPRPLRLFDRLPAGATVAVSPGSRVSLAFVSGLRYELGERSRVKIGNKDLASRTGIVRALPRVPPLPSLSPIALEDRPGPKAGAVRIRAERVTGLYPHSGAAVLAGRPVLTFEPLKQGGLYRVEVQDSHGNVVFRADIEAPVIRLPERTLLAGAGYHWTVRTLDRAGPIGRGEADFVTLPEHTARAREELRAAVEKEGNGEDLALLAGLDRSLGMLRESREELQAVLAKFPGNAILAEELAALEQQLEGED